MAAIILLLAVVHQVRTPVATSNDEPIVERAIPYPEGLAGKLLVGHFGSSPDSES